MHDRLTFRSTFRARRVAFAATALLVATSADGRILETKLSQSSAAPVAIRCCSGFKNCYEGPSAVTKMHLLADGTTEEMIVAAWRAAQTRSHATGEGARQAVAERTDAQTGETTNRIEAARAALTNEAVLKLVKGGLSEDVVVKMIEGQPAKFSLLPDDLLALKRAGASDRVIAAMLDKNSGSGAAPAGAAKSTRSSSVRVGPKTPIRLVVEDTISSKTAKSGDIFRLAVADDVLIDGQVVLAKGAPAVGRIVSVKKKSFATHNGEIGLAVDSARAVDGRDVPLEGRITVGGEGIGFGRFGKNVEIGKGYLVNAVVASETEVKPQKAR